MRVSKARGVAVATFIPKALYISWKASYRSRSWYPQQDGRWSPQNCLTTSGEPRPVLYRLLSLWFLWKKKTVLWRAFDLLNSCVLQVSPAWVPFVQKPFQKSQSWKATSQVMLLSDQNLSFNLFEPWKTNGERWRKQNGELNWLNQAFVAWPSYVAPFTKNPKCFLLGRLNRKALLKGLQMGW